MLCSSSSFLSLLEGENKGIILIWDLSIKSSTPLPLILTLVILAVILGVSCSHVWEIGMTLKEISPLLSLFWSCKWNYFLFSATPSPVLSGECSSMWKMSCLGEVWRQRAVQPPWVKQRCWRRRFPFSWLLTRACLVLPLPWTCTLLLDPFELIPASLWWPNPTIPI